MLPIKRETNKCISDSGDLGTRRLASSRYLLSSTMNREHAGAGRNDHDTAAPILSRDDLLVPDLKDPTTPYSYLSRLSPITVSSTYLNTTNATSSWTLKPRFDGDSEFCCFLQNDQVDFYGTVVDLLEQIDTFNQVNTGHSKIVLYNVQLQRGHGRLCLHLGVYGHCVDDCRALLALFDGPPAGCV